MHSTMLALSLLRCAPGRRVNEMPSRALRARLGHYFGGVEGSQQSAPQRIVKLLSDVVSMI